MLSRTVNLPISNCFEIVEKREAEKEKKGGTFKWG